MEQFLSPSMGYIIRNTAALLGVDASTGPVTQVIDVLKDLRWREQDSCRPLGVSWVGVEPDASAMDEDPDDPTGIRNWY